MKIFLKHESSLSSNRQSYDHSNQNFMKMKKALIVLIISIFLPQISPAQLKIDSIIPIRGLCINAPHAGELKEFIQFIGDELVPRKINTLILQVEYNYKFISHPELSDPDGLSKEDVKEIVEMCRKSGIMIIPQINLLGHQSWSNRTGNLLRVYPGFDETPWVKMPEKYVWPNDDKLYCKSYCPLHPEVHKIVFDLMDELCDVYEATAFHAGMDEVFYIGEDKCPRCAGKDKSVLFADEVKLIRDHLSATDRKLWIWGDRLLDGRTTGLGEWEASFNDTYRAIDLIPKDVVICDWHYEKPVPTAVYFAMKGFTVVTCPWRDPSTAVSQTEDMIRWRSTSSDGMSDRFAGIVQTVWSGTGEFMKSFKNSEGENGKMTPGNCFRVVFDKVSELNK
jgi:hypothetical protein